MKRMGHLPLCYGMCCMRYVLRVLQNLLPRAQHRLLHKNLQPELYLPARLQTS